MEVVDSETRTAAVRDALEALGIERLVLAVHDPSFPSEADEDTGRGSPYTRGGHAFAAFASELGFDGLQLGPQGHTSRVNRSPYDGMAFSKSALSLPLARLAGDDWDRMLDAPFVERALFHGDRSRVAYAHAFDAHREAVARAAARIAEGVARAERWAVDRRRRADEFFAANAGWLAHDAEGETLARAALSDDVRRWPIAADIAKVEGDLAWILTQHLLDEEHRRFRAHARALGLRVYGDLHVGLSARDVWRRERMFLAGYLLGAPPSRTNPEGQPWGYPVFDPAHESEARAFVAARVARLLGDFDGLRIDHPHGLVCPWVYADRAVDPHRAVREGARLFESPSDPRHPALARYARVSLDQIDDRVAAYDDARVTHLTPAQIDRYASLFDVVMQSAPDRGDIACEVLSTCPCPLAAVMARWGLGRFRVTQKASLTDRRDGYRSENAHRDDWIMIGNHDTEPLLAVVARWAATGTLAARAAYLAERLGCPVVPSPEGVARAMAAELFVGPATRVLVYWGDLFGERAPYNTPGLVSEANWSMRIPPDYRSEYTARRARGEAIDLEAALATALRARRVRPELADALSSVAR